MSTSVAARISSPNRRISQRRAEMLRLIARRLVLLVVALLVSSFAIFASLYLAGADPIATLSRGRSLSPEVVEHLRQQYHLDEPFLARYLTWLGNVVLHGDLGSSIAYRQDVASIIGERIGLTLKLVFYAGLLIVLFGGGLGILSGLRRGVVDSAVVVLTSVFVAVPAFVAAIGLVFVFSVELGWFPAAGAGHGFADEVRHLTLPAVALALASAALVARVTRAAVRTELGREHVQTAVSRGIPYSKVIGRHVLRNAAIPVTTVVGIAVASLFALSAIVEQAFSLNGLGAALIQAAGSNDLQVVQGITLVLVAAFVIANTAVDLLYTLLDPRVGAGGRTS